MKQKYKEDEVLTIMRQQIKEKEQLINELQEAIKPRWIPVEERLPEEGQEVIVSDGNYVYLVEYDSDFGFDDVDATAWMPSPEPYRPENHEI